MRTKLSLVLVLAAAITLSMAAVAVARAYVPGEPLTVGFIYVGPIGDYGWTFAHNRGRLALEEAFPWVTTLYVESVPKAEVGAIIDLLVAQGADIIFTTSFGFMDGTLAAAARHPNVIFGHCSGFKRAPNVMTYMADFYQLYYLAGLMAGALSETDRIGYVAAFPIPEVKRHINAFTIGAREVNPAAEVHVRWLFAWFAPAAAKEATEALIADGADVIMFTEDSPTVAVTAAGHGLPSFSHYSPMYEFAPDHIISGKLVHWEKIYLDFVAKVFAGLYTPENLEDVDYWGLLKGGAVEMGADYGMPINPALAADLKAVMVDDPLLGEISVYDLVFARFAQMEDFQMVFDPFTGPIYDRTGVLRIFAGARADYDHLLTMEWAVKGVVGPWPGEP